MSPRAVIALFFLVSAGVVTAAVYSAVDGPRHFGLHFGDGCDLAITGDEPQPSSQATTARREGDRWVALRTLTYRLAPMAEGTIGACADTGGVSLVAGSADAIVVEAKVHGYATTEQAARDAAQDVQPEIRASLEHVWAWQPVGSARYASGVGATVSFRVLVPPQMLVEADLRTDTGGVDVRGVRLSGLRASADTGGIEVEPAWAQGSIEADTDTGGVFARFAALGDATMRFGADTGGVKVYVPGGARHGYDVKADTDTGGVDVLLPGAEDVERATRTHRHVRTAGFEDREVQVTLDASTDTGGVTVGVS